MNIFIASDHAGFELKGVLIEALSEIGYTVIDCGSYAYHEGDDYPQFISKAARAVSEAESVRKSEDESLSPINTAPTVQVTYAYARNLRQNMSGEDVRRLQIFLNAQGFSVSNTGAGSLGNETNFFGPATRSALVRFQKANKITPAVGFLGPITRALIGSFDGRK